MSDDTIIEQEPYKPYVFAHITEGNMSLDDLFQTVLETNDEETCQTALDLINSTLHTQVIINKLMSGDYGDY